MAQFLQTGSGVKIVANGRVIGFATGLAFQRTQSTKTIYELDNPLAREIAPTTYSVSGSLSGIRVRDQGGLDGASLMDLSSIQSFFYQKYCVIEIVDKLTNKVIYTFQYVMFDSDSWQMNAKSVITFNANFKAVFLSNEVGDKS